MMKCLVALVKRPTKASTTSASIPEPAASEHDTPITDGSRYESSSELTASIVM